LINEGGYPYRVATASTWCHRLVAGLDEHDFHLVTIVDGPLQRSYPVLTNNPSLTPVPLAGRPVAPEKGPARTQHRRAATHAAVLLCRGMLDDSPHGATMFRTALRRLTGLAADGTHPLVGVPLAQVLLDAWRTAAGSGRTSLARITMADAEIAGYLLESSLRVLSVAPPEVELCHVVDGGLATLVALGARWRAGVPYVVTEHDAYLRAELAERAGPRPGVRAVLLRFLRALNRLGYAEAAAIIAPSERMRRWALHHDADRGRLRVVPPGVDPQDHPRLDDPPDHPVMAWVGPPEELPLLRQAFRTLRETVPDARLVLVGSGPPGPLPDGMSWSGPVPVRPAVFARARVVTISGADEAMPYPLIEAMFSGRPTVCTEHGGLAAAVGIAGLVVPPADPARLAAAWVSLLTDDGLRRQLATSARSRARTLFSLGAMLDGFRSAYSQATTAPADHGDAAAPATTGPAEEAGRVTGIAGPPVAAFTGPTWQVPEQAGSRRWQRVLAELSR
jgi:glycosyltransferase involved in cell wall biosynthesis